MIDVGCKGKGRSKREREGVGKEKRDQRIKSRCDMLVRLRQYVREPLQNCISEFLMMELTSRRPPIRRKRSDLMGNVLWKKKQGGEGRG